MNVQYYLDGFFTALWWNGALYGLYKVCSLSFTLLLYYLLPAEVFSLWITLTSITYLMLLWSDFGLRKAIARYGLVCGGKIATWYNHIIVFQIAVYGALFPFWYFFIQYKVPVHYQLLFTCSLFSFFVVRGLVELIKSFYHALFKNQYFNTWNMIALFSEFLISCALCLFSFDPFVIVALLFFIATSVYIVLLVYAFVQLQPLILLSYDTHTASSFTYRTFIKHAVSMWYVGVSKSFSERNFLIPLVSFVSGTVQGNNFKITYDAALFIYRIGLRVMGSNDTVLLSIAYIQNCKKLLHTTVSLVHTTYIKLFVILFIFGCILLSVQPIFFSHIIFPLFFIVGISYTLEMFLLPYERFLEVKQQYIPLITITIFYSIGFLVMLYCYIYNMVSFLFFIGGIHSLRLIYSFFCMIWYTVFK